MKPLVLELDGNGGYLIVNLHSIKIMNVAERIRTNIENHDFIFADQRMKVTISGGVAVFNHETNPVMVPKDLVNQADQGLYMSKHNGRNRITYAPPSLVALDGLNN